jgi:hypothetical protein
MAALEKLIFYIRQFKEAITSTIPPGDFENSYLHEQVFALLSVNERERYQFYLLWQNLPETMSSILQWAQYRVSSMETTHYDEAQHATFYPPIATNAAPLQLCPASIQVSNALPIEYFGSSDDPIVDEEYVFAYNIRNPRCIYKCDQYHTTDRCKKFLDLTPKQRYKAITEAKGCILCLRQSHSVSRCRLRRFSCRHGACGKRHHTLLHFTEEEPQVKVTTIQDQEEAEEEEYTPEIQLMVCAMNDQAKVTIALPTVPVKVKFGEKIVLCNALLDSGASATIMSKALAKRLQLA